jgi:hypothetical protein
MIDLSELGTEAFDYFPIEFLQEETVNQGISDRYEEHLATLHTDNLWDTSLVLPGAKVKTSDGLTGLTTSYHLTEIGQINGGIEVILEGGGTGYYYACQLRKVRN